MSTAHIAPQDVVFTAIRAQGAGGQHVNKVSSAVHLRFEIAPSSLPEDVKARLLALSDRRISAEGVVVIKAQGSRSLDQNKAEALERLRELIRRAWRAPRARKPTKPTASARRERLADKAARGDLKRQRGHVQAHE